MAQTTPKQVPLYKIPERREVARVLDDSVLSAYNDSIQLYNERARQNLSKFGSANGQLTGSSPLMLLQLANSGLFPTEARLATRKDLETAISFDGSFLRGNYVDFGLSLRTAGDSYEPNDLLAKRLAEQLKQKGIELGSGKLIPIKALRLKEEPNSGYGLVFDLNELATKETIADLDAFKWDYKREGLSCAYLYRGRGWSSYDRSLADSSGSGRVVLVSAEGTSQNFLDERLAKLREQRDKKIAEIQERYTKAEAILRDQ